MTAEPSCAQTIGGQVHQRANGRGRLSVFERVGRTCLDVLYQEGCIKLRLPNTHSNAIEAVLINTAGGLAGGDDIHWRVEAGARTRLALTTQACERVYRSLGPDATVECSLSVGAGAHVDWLPQETILFEDCRLKRTLDIDLEEGASVTALEAVLLGRDAMGETARHARFADRWRIRRNGRLLHAETTRLAGDPMLERDGLSLLAGANAFASVVHISPRAEALHARLRVLLEGFAEAAVSLTGDRLVLRALAPSGLALRRLLVPAIEILSGAGTVPRLWLS